MGLYWKLQDIKDLYLGMYIVIFKCVKMTMSNFFKLQRRIYHQTIFFLNSISDPAFPNNYFMFSQT